ncbi:putative quinol monooxygenase [Leucobacter sp. UCMA 4100]|uniref:putative quinol monooxygenase n=1 Tax=Leucobacter sp. UCMA 4100 TaxID=2810534 RepID=UPI0022EAD70C|nr:antibiotic biosynthesis monooxygenase [Leucobacter sp. UCMA 4100]
MTGETLMKGHIALRGRLICRTPKEAETVRTHLPAHEALSRAEPGCVSFEVTATDDPLVWHVAEQFSSEEAFAAHQRRVAASEWGLVTAGITREYHITRG